MFKFKFHAVQNINYKLNRNNFDVYRRRFFFYFVVVESLRKNLVNISVYMKVVPLKP